MNNFSDFDVVGQTGDGTEAVWLAAELRPEVIIMDVIMPEKGGIDACREIMDLLPGTRVLVLTASTAPAAVVEAVAAGAAGYRSYLPLKHPRAGSRSGSLSPCWWNDQVALAGDIIGRTAIEVKEVNEWTATTLAIC